MYDAWSIDEGLIYAISHVRFPLTYSAASYQIGPGAQFNVPATPTRIYNAYFINVNGGLLSSSTLQHGGTGYAAGDTGYVVNGSGNPAMYTVLTVAAGAVVTYEITAPNAGTGFIPQNGYRTQVGGGQPGAGSGFTLNVTSVTPTGQNRNSIKIVNANQHYSHGDLSALALTPDELYPDYEPDADGFVRLYLWPILSIGPAAVELDIGAPFSQWTLTQNYNIPKGYADAINYALAFRLIPRFGSAVAQSVVEVVTELGQKAELRIREMNKFNRQMPQGSEMLEPPQPTKAA